MISKLGLGFLWKCHSLVIRWEVSCLCGARKGLKPAELCQASFDYQPLITNENRWCWLRWEVLALFWGTSEQEFQEHWHCFSLVQEIWCWLIFDVCQSWCFCHLEVFPLPHPTPLWIATFEDQWLQSPDSQGSSSGASHPSFLSILLGAGWQSLFRTCANALLWNVKSTNNCQLGHLLQTPTGWFVWVLLKKGSEQGKGPAQKEELVGCLAHGCGVKPVRAAQKGVVWCNWVAPGLRLPLETAQAFWCILLFFFFFIMALQLSGWLA